MLLRRPPTRPARHRLEVAIGLRDNRCHKLGRTLRVVRRAQAPRRPRCQNLVNACPQPPTREHFRTRPNVLHRRDGPQRSRHLRWHRIHRLGQTLRDHRKRRHLHRLTLALHSQLLPRHEGPPRPPCLRHVKCPEPRAPDNDRLGKRVHYQSSVQPQLLASYGQHSLRHGTDRRGCPVHSAYHHRPRVRHPELRGLGYIRLDEGRVRPSVQ
mmetsp:Transcript_10200/g.32333  ORF Transcript_10200/g.32333 Transcript_10200/m.32333 type:complete len:211 (+) Transcript_10200:1422-2054(+)